MRFIFRKIVSEIFDKITLVKWDHKLTTRRQVEYILALYEIYEKVKDIPGHIIEIGCGRARNGIILSTLIKKSGQDKYKKYFGFDTFKSFTDKDLVESPHLKKQSVENLDSLEKIEDFIISNKLNDVIKLVKGDIIKTLPEFIKNKNKEFYFDQLLISLVYIDCNAYRPAIFALEKLKPYLSNNAMIVVDENMLGDETKALKKFCDDNLLVMRSPSNLNHISAITEWINK